MACGRPRLRTLASVAISVVALVTQALLLPLAHAEHDRHSGGARSAQPAARSTDGRLPAYQTTAGAAHDTATCPLCTTLAHGRTAVLTESLRVRHHHAEIGTAFSPTHLAPTAPVQLSARPRAPPPVSA